MIRINWVAYWLGAAMIVAFGGCSAEPKERSRVAVAGAVRPSPPSAADCASAAAADGGTARVEVPTCDDSSGGASPPKPPDEPALQKSRTGYDIVYRLRTETEKRGLAIDISYRANLAPDASSAEYELKGDGRYQGVVVTAAANCHLDPHLQPPRKTFQLSGNLEATGSVVEKQISFTLATTDWKFIGSNQLAETPEDQEGAKGLGTVAEVLVPLTGRSTRHHEKRVSHNDCDGAVTTSVDISIDAQGDRPSPN